MGIMDKKIDDEQLNEVSGGRYIDNRNSNARLWSSTEEADLKNRDPRLQGIDNTVRTNSGNIVSA